MAAAEPLVDAREVVEAELDHRQLVAVAAGVDDRHGQPVGEAPTAGEARERVLVRERADLLLEAHARRPLAGERRFERAQLLAQDAHLLLELDLAPRDGGVGRHARGGLCRGLAGRRRGCFGRGRRRSGFRRRGRALAHVARQHRHQGPPEALPVGHGRALRRYPTPPPRVKAPPRFSPRLRAGRAAAGRATSAWPARAAAVSWRPRAWWVKASSSHDSASAGRSRSARSSAAAARSSRISRCGSRPAAVAACSSLRARSPGRSGSRARRGRECDRPDGETCRERARQRAGPCSGRSHGGRCGERRQRGVRGNAEVEVDERMDRERGERGQGALPHGVHDRAGLRARRASGAHEQEREARECRPEAEQPRLGECLEVVVLGVLDAQDSVAALEARVGVVEGAQAVPHERARGGEPQRVLPGVEPERGAAQAAHALVGLLGHQPDQDPSQHERRHQRRHERPAPASAPEAQCQQAAGAGGEGHRPASRQRRERRESHREGRHHRQDHAGGAGVGRPVAAAAARLVG